MKRCACGRTFLPSRRSQKKCRPTCGREKGQRVGKRTVGVNRASRKGQLAPRVRFVAVDGEGITLADGSHHYVVLSVGDQTLHHDGAPLSTDDIFAFLWQCYERDPDATYVGYFLGYDFAQWLKGLPEDRARMLLTDEGVALRKRKRSGGNPIPFPVGWQRWEFDMLAMKRFKLRRKGAKRWMYVCDCGPFFQSSFLGAIEPTKKKWPQDPPCTQQEYDRIAEGKGQRSIATFDAAMIEYNLLENEILARLMARYQEGLRSMGIALTRTQWYGPGQAAAKWLEQIGAPTREQVAAATSPAVLDAAISTYYGGWFEILGHGHIGQPVHEYDICSAYPYQIAQLPCLLHGTWTTGRGDPPDAPYVMVRATVRGKNVDMGPLPCRDDKGRIFRPRQVTGWYWAHEIAASHAAGLVSSVDVYEWHAYQPCACAPPVRAIADLYDERVRVGKNSVGGKARKLVYNSSYGKFAQSVGAAAFANPIYASLITAGTRVQILRAIATHPQGVKAVVMIATDGLYFTSPHPSLRLSEALGDWEYKVRTGMTLALPGVYWDDDARARIAAGDAPAFKSRGISAKVLAGGVAALDAAWSAFELPILQPYPSGELQIEFSMVNPRAALARGKWHLAGACGPAVRVINCDPTEKRREMHHNGRYWRSRSIKGHFRTVPYEKRFGLELAEKRENDDMTDDGMAGTLLREVFHG